MAWYNIIIGAIGNTAFWAGLALLIMIFLGFVAFLIYQWRVYNITVHVFRYMGANKYPQRVGVYKARMIKTGKAGEQKLLVKINLFNKVLRTAYGKMMSSNEYWFVINPRDGMWVNFVMGDLDAKNGVIDIDPTDPNVRDFWVNNATMVNKKFDPQSWLEKWTPTIVLFVFVILLITGGWFLTSKLGATAETINRGISALEPVAEKMDGVLSKLDLICSTSGVRPA